MGEGLRLPSSAKETTEACVCREFSTRIERVSSACPWQICVGNLIPEKGRRRDGWGNRPLSVRMPSCFCFFFGEIDKDSQAVRMSGWRACRIN